MKKEIIMELKGEEWENLLDASWNKKKKDVELKGFRKGQVPKDVYIKQVGIESLYMDAVDEATDVLYRRLLEENKDLEIAARPSVDVTKIDATHLEMKFTLVLKPEVKLGKYKDLGIKKEKAVVTDEEIDHELMHLREEYVELKDKEGKVEVNDEVTIDFEGFIDGKAFDGGKAEDYNLVIGSHSFIPGFEEGLVGTTLNEEKDLELTFPENYHVEDLKGKKVIFKVKVKGIKERVLPEYNKEFFEDLNMEGVDSLETLREELKNHIMSHKERDIEDKYLEEIIGVVNENATIDVPSEMIDDEVEHMLNDFSQRLSYQGLQLETYLKMLNTDVKSFKENFKGEAEKRVRFRLCLEEVIKSENIEVTAEEVDNYVKELAGVYNVSEEELVKEIGGKETLKYDLKVKKALDIMSK